ncbi:radical SAM family heme chaperone HemW [Fretibacter rubidus]|uniref:radical SAM family heme chaperone HemW n=1 Tax=Fretibacter rubidus TaxID=570162 RepID=UPI00352AAD6B
MLPLAVYVHWPYCARICPYCDFNVFKNRDNTAEKTALLSAIIDDLSTWRQRTGAREITSVHFGGGTPSLMTDAQIGAVLTAVDRLWGLPKGCEIALEANPTDAAAQKWTAFRDVGVNRLSLGVQSFDDDVLRALGRDHDGAGGYRAAQTAMDIFPSVSLDLIFGHSGQSVQDWDADLSRALTLSPHHISAYQLTIEPGTAFAKAKARGEDKAVDDDSSSDLYYHGTAVLGAAGYDHYEVSNHAKPGHASQHNLAYWRGWDYVGVGPGAHGRVTEASSAHGRVTKDGVRYATVCAKRPQDYTARVRAKGTALVDDDALSPAAWGEEYIMMGLRINEGISLRTYKDITGEDLPKAVIETMTEHGFLDTKEGRIFATPSGRAVLNTISAKLLGA